MRKEKIRAIERRLGPKPGTYFFRYWDDSPGIVRKLLPGYDPEFKAIVQREEVGELQRVEDWTELPIELMGSSIEPAGLATSRPAISGMHAFFRTEGGLANWAIEIFKTA